MTKYLQTDPKWANEKLGYSNTTISENGCFVTSLGMLSNTPPNQVNNLLKNRNGFSGASQNLVNSEKASDILNLEYHGKSPAKPSYDTIAEVVMPQGQHFIIVLANGTQVDPLGKRTDYKIKNYRLFRKESEVSETLAEKYGRWWKQRKAEAIKSKALYDKYFGYVKRRKNRDERMKKVLASDENCETKLKLLTKIINEM
jgi:hypothetical protein